MQKDGDDKLYENNATSPPDRVLQKLKRTAGHSKTDAMQRAESSEPPTEHH